MPITPEELAKHNTEASLWIAIHGNVYDLTDFLQDHPGGTKILLHNAGKDGTETYEQIHEPNMISENLEPEQQLGPLLVKSKL